MLRPTSHDVARLAGVSQPTVSRALRDDARISDDTRRRVRAAAQQLGYVASRRGRSLSTRATGHVAVVVSDLGNPFYAEAVQHLHAAVEARGARTVVLTDPPAAPPPAEELLDGSVDGAVLTTALLGSPLPAELSRRGLPVVLLNRTVDGAVADACVSENAAGARMAAEELVSLGHRRIAAIFGPAHTSTGRDREQGFQAALADAGVPLPAKRVRRGPFAYETGRRALHELLTGTAQPTAIFCGNDVIAIGALNAAREAGVAVPGELAVIGFDDIAMAAWPLFALSTVRQDLAAMAETAIELLFARVAKPQRPLQRVTVPTTLVRRRSHGPARPAR